MNYVKLFRHIPRFVRKCSLRLSQAINRRIRNRCHHMCTYIHTYIHTYLHTLYGRGKPAQKFGERFPCRAATRCRHFWLSAFTNSGAYLTLPRWDRSSGRRNCPRGAGVKSVSRRCSSARWLDPMGTVWSSFHFSCHHLSF